MHRTVVFCNLATNESIGCGNAELHIEACISTAMNSSKLLMTGIQNQQKNDDE